MPEVSGAAAETAAESDQSSAWVIIAIGLLVVRWLLPAESTASGATLWLVAAWLLLAASWTLARLRDWSIAPLRLDRVDLAVALLIIPQLVSALLIYLRSDGNARAAANMGCEWIAVLVSFVLLRRWLRGRADFGAVVRLGLAVAFGISLLGIWQHHVGYRRAIADFDKLENELSIAQQVGNISTIRRVQSELAAAGIPLSGPARELWERRLRDSREPYGFFALANSLGGLLAPLLLFGIAFWPAARRCGWPVARLAVFVAILLLVAYCLLLTKSRTAWVGLAAGALVLVGNDLWKWLRERPRQAALAGGIPLLLVMAALATGGIDREVLTEAPKSLAYRLEYWQGTLGVIRDRPLTGTGPGNFRQHYLAHKLESSSEEIADPHNFVLEATATGGLLGLAGLGGCVILLVTGRREPEGSPAIPATEGVGSVTLLGGSCGFALGLAPSWLLGGTTDLRLLGVLLGCGAACACLSGLTLEKKTRRRASLAAIVALVVHLSGAGGFSRPALMQLLLLLVIGWRPWCDIERSPQEATESAPLKSARLTALCCGLLFVLVSVLGLLPVFEQSTNADTATHSLLGGRPANAARLLQDAQRADRLDPTPARRLALLKLDLAESDVDDDELLDQAVRAANTTLHRDPHNWAAAHVLARAHRLRWRTRRDDDDRQRMIDWGTTAVNRYPSSPRLHAWLAETLAEAGLPRPARDQAQTTLRLHRLLKQRGHVDKLLSDQRLEQMRDLLTPPVTATPVSRGSGGGP